MRKLFVLLGLVVCAVLIEGCEGCGCGPAAVEPLEEIKPNETAFLVPLEGATKTNQGKFMSVEYLNQNKIASKRVIIPIRERNIGRGPGAYEWIPTMKVIRVDRTPITREWTKSAKTGTTSSDQAIAVESRESINFKVGVTLTATVTEEDAAVFLYRYAGVPLATVIDTNVRGFVQSFLAREFGQLKIDDCREKKIEIFKRLAELVRNEFKDRGVTVLNVGNSEGLSYDKEEVQQAIDNAYISHRQLEKARVDAETAVVKAEGEAKAAVTEARGKSEANRLLQSSITSGVIELKKVEAWDGKLPQVTGGSVPMINLK